MPSDRQFVALTKPIMRGGIPYYVWIGVVVGGGTTFIAAYSPEFGFINTVITVGGVCALLWTGAAYLTRKEPQWVSLGLAWLKAGPARLYSATWKGRTYDV